MSIKLATCLLFLPINVLTKCMPMKNYACLGKSKGETFKAQIGNIKIHKCEEWEKIHSYLIISNWKILNKY